LEEIEEMFRDGALKPWQTKVGGSHLDAQIAAVANQRRKVSADFIDDKAQVIHETKSEKDLKV
jgi:hypothetical protein